MLLIYIFFMLVEIISIGLEFSFPGVRLLWVDMGSDVLFFRGFM